MSFPLFPCICQFCNKKFVANDLCNCCTECYELYKKGKLKKKKETTRQ